MGLRGPIWDPTVTHEHHTCCLCGQRFPNFLSEVPHYNEINGHYSEENQDWVCKECYLIRDYERHLAEEKEWDTDTSEPM